MADGIREDAQEIGQNLIEYKKMSDTEFEEKLEKLQREIIADISWADMSFDELLSSRERMSVLFGEGQVRNYRHPVYFDANAFKAIRKIERLIDLPGLAVSLEFILVKLGRQKSFTLFGSKAGAINTLIRTMDDDPTFTGAIEHLKPMSINQTAGGIDQVKIGFTNTDYDAIKSDAKYFGITVSSYLVVCFWLGVIAVDDLDESLKEYGRGIVDQFDKTLKMREATLRVQHKTYSI